MDDADGSFAPFKHRAFAVIWAANVISLVGTWMSDVGAGWLMASLKPSPLWVALVHTSTTLPVLLFALPAGAIADLVDRRRVILVGQTLMALGAAGFAALVHLERATPWGLLLFTFFLGTGLAFYGPARNAVVPDLVPREHLHAAVMLNSIGVNLARAIGPALAGFIIAWLGLTAPFAVNAVSYLAVVAAFLWWRAPAKPASTVPREAVWGAMASGLRFARGSALLRAALLRTLGFFIFASAYFSQLPLIAKQMLGGDSALYGILLGCIGAGAVGGGLLLGRLRRRFGANGILNGAAVLAAIAMVLVARWPAVWVAVLASLLFGAAWVLSLSLLNAAAQLVLPDWVRGRGMALLMTTLFGSLAAGSALWGQVAERTDIGTALVTSAAACVLALFALRARRIADRPLEGLTPVGIPMPVTAGDIPPGTGPVAISIEYRVPGRNTSAFLTAMQDLAAARRRYGAYNWGLFEDAEHPGRFVETYLEASWAAHQRHHARISEADLALKARIDTLLDPAAGPPEVRHFLPPRAGWGQGGSPVAGSVPDAV